VATERVQADAHDYDLRIAHDDVSSAIAAKA